MKWIGRLPITGDEVVIEVHLGWTVLIFALVQLPLVGDKVVELIRNIF